MPSLGKKAFASTVFPYKNEILISNQERTKEKVSFKNDSKKDISFTPLVYSYNPQTQEMTDVQSYIFVRADKEVFKVRPNETIELEYEVIPPLNIESGTYFNLIVFRTQTEDSFINQTNPIGVIDNISHLVVLHITDSEGNIRGITNEFAIITLQIVDKGIPFIRPTTLKYTFQNITNYVLSPMGELQIYNKKGKYAPIYLKINQQEEKLYPGGLLEEEFKVEKWDITDIYNQRVIVGRFYNGIDENFILKEVIQEPHYILLAVSILCIISLIILIKAVIEDRKKPKEKIE